MSETATATLPPAMTRSAPLDVDALYRSCADELFAYACTVVRDRSAAEEVVAVTFERALARRAAVAAAIDRLPGRDRELVALKFHAGLGNAEIAAVLGISATNAGSRLHRVLTTLREACRAAS